MTHPVVNIHLGWFTKKRPPQVPKKQCYSLHFIKIFWDLWGPFLGDPPKWKISITQYTLKEKWLASQDSSSHCNAFESCSCTMYTVRITHFFKWHEIA